MENSQARSSVTRLSVTGKFERFAVFLQVREEKDQNQLGKE